MSETQSCPCCGQMLPADGGFRLDDAGFVLAGGRFAALTRQEHEILGALHAAQGRMVTRERLHGLLYPNEADEAEIKIIDVFVCKLRKKLNALGVSVQTVWGRGYRLALNGQGEQA